MTKTATNKVTPRVITLIGRFGVNKQTTMMGITGHITAKFLNDFVPSLLSMITALKIDSRKYRDVVIVAAATMPNLGISSQSPKNFVTPIDIPISSFGRMRAYVLITGD